MALKRFRRFSPSAKSGESVMYLRTRRHHRERSSGYDAAMLTAHVLNSSGGEVIDKVTAFGEEE
jgi:hypothetical protein